MTTCPHCEFSSAVLEPYDPDGAKAGRSFCVACNCSFDGVELVTRGVDCDARSIIEDEQQETEEQEQTTRPRSRRRAES